ncbi:MAG: calcium/sodium antiporter [Oscillochloridaceae bacterium umkhey_bin13]
MTPLVVVLFIIGIVLLIWGADLLVRGASNIAAAFGVPPLVIGLTVVALGTSSPELAVSIQAVLAGQPDLTLGNVVGSNIANVLLILGIAALVAPLVVAPQLLRREVPVMIGVSLLVWWLASDGLLGQIEGAILVTLLLVFLGGSVWLTRREMADAAVAQPLPLASAHRKPRALLRNLGLAVLGLIMLIIGAQWLVDSAVAVARALGVSELLIGLTIVAVGTSLPEIATSVLAGLRGEREIAIGNVVGSNILNLLAVLGLTALLAPAALVVPPATLAFDLPVMVAAAIVCLPIFFNGLLISRWEGALFLSYYVAYTTYLILHATRSEALDEFSFTMLFVIIPLTVLALAIGTFRGIQERRAAGS